MRTLKSAKSGRHFLVKSTPSIVPLIYVAQILSTINIFKGVGRTGGALDDRAKIRCELGALSSLLVRFIPPWGLFPLGIFQPLTSPKQWGNKPSRSKSEVDFEGF